MIETTDHSDGILLPPKSSVVLPELKVLRPHEEAVAKPAVDTGARSAVSSILQGAVDVFTGSGLSVVTENTTQEIQLPSANPTPEPVQPSHNREVLHFLARPWDYVHSTLFKHIDASPIPEIKEKIAELLASNIPPESKILLQSPYSFIRKDEEFRLRQLGIDPHLIFRPETALLDVAQLEYSFGTEPPDTPPDLTQFYENFRSCVDQVFLGEGGLKEQLAQVQYFCSYLLPVMEAVLYRSQQYRFSSPELLDHLAEKLEFLTSQSLSNEGKKALLSFFDLLSFFEINSADAARVFLKLLTSQKIAHPIKHELMFYLQYPEENQPSTPKVGMEIEAVPKVIGFAIPEGFTVGIDGSGSLPEYTRDTEELEFTTAYRRDLYSLWFWARKSRLVGASLHLHLDDPDGRLLRLFGKVFGSNWYDLRENEPSGTRTVELRFNLSGYRVKQDSAKFDISQPFTPELFDVTSFIECVLKIAETENLEDLTQTIHELPPYWQQFFTREKMHGFDELWRVVLAFNLNKTTEDKVIEALHRFSGDLTPDVFLQLGEKTRWNHDILLEALKKLAGSLTLDQVLQIGDESNWSQLVFMRVLKKITGSLTLEHVYQIGEKSAWKLTIIELALEALEERLTLDQMIALGEKMSQTPRIQKLCLEKLAGGLTLPQLFEFGRRNAWNSFLLTTALCVLNEDLSMKQLQEIGHACSWNSDVVIEALYKLGEKLTVTQIFDLAQKSDWNHKVLSAALTKIPDSLSLDQVVELVHKRKLRETTAFTSMVRGLHRSSQQSIKLEDGWDPRILEHALQKLKEGLTLDQFFQLATECKWHHAVIPIALEKVTEKLTLDQAIQISKECEWLSNIVRKTLLKLEGRLSLEQILILGDECNWRDYVIRTALEQFDGEYSDENLYQLGELTKWDDRILQLFIARSTPLPREWCELIMKKTNNLVLWSHLQVENNQQLALSQLY